jgi:hypothetical protein
MNKKTQMSYLPRQRLWYMGLDEKLILPLFNLF